MAPLSSPLMSSLLTYTSLHFPIHPSLRSSSPALIFSSFFLFCVSFVVGYQKVFQTSPWRGVWQISTSWCRPEGRFSSLQLTHFRCSIWFVALLLLFFWYLWCFVQLDLRLSQSLGFTQTLFFHRFTSFTGKSVKMVLCVCVCMWRANSGVRTRVAGGLMSLTGQYVYMNFHKTPLRISIAMRLRTAPTSRTDHKSKSTRFPEQNKGGRSPGGSGGGE